jgi:hypothetical protein
MASTIMVAIDDRAGRPSVKLSAGAHVRVRSIYFAAREAGSDPLRTSSVHRNTRERAVPEVTTHNP